MTIEILVDLDGTLCDSEFANQQVREKIVDYLVKNSSFSAKEIGRLYDQSIECIEYLSCNSGLELRRRRLEFIIGHIDYSGINLVALSEEMQLWRDSAFRLLPYCKEFLEFVKSISSLTIITEGYGDIQNPYLEKLGILKSNTRVLITTEHNVSKFDGSAYHLVNTWTNNRSTKLMIGDNWVGDVAIPDSIGMHTIWISRMPKIPGNISNRFFGQAQDLKYASKLIVSNLS